MKPLALNKPHLLIMTGLPGSGKSHFAVQFSKTFKSPYVSFDQLFKLSDDNERLAGSYMKHLLSELFKTNHTIIVDGLASSKSNRLELKHLADLAGYQPLFIWVQTDEATIKTRLKKSPSSGRLISKFSAPEATEKPIIVISGKHTYPTQAKTILRYLAASKRTLKDATSHEKHPAVARRGVTVN